MKQEVALNTEEPGSSRAIQWLLDMRLSWSQQQNGRNSGFDNKRFTWSKTPRVDGFTGKLPTHSVWVKVVSVTTDIEIEDVPTNALSCTTHDGGSVADKRTTVDTQARNWPNWPNRPNWN